MSTPFEFVRPDPDPWVNPLPGGTFDASRFSPDVQSLRLEKMMVPRGELAKLPRLRRLVISALQGAELDLTGCTALEMLWISGANKLQRIDGAETLTRLTTFSIGSCPALEEVPDLSLATGLREVRLSSLVSAASIAPAVQSPALEKIELRNEVPLPAGVVESIRDLPNLRAFSWTGSKKVPRALPALVGKIVGRPRDWSPSEEQTLPVPAGASTGEVAAAPSVEIIVSCSMATAWGGFFPVYTVGELMVEGAPDLGPAISRIEIDLFPSEEAEGEFASSVREWMAFRETLPKIRFRRSAGSVLIRARSELDGSRLHEGREGETLPIFREACQDVLAALETLRKRVKSTDDFDLAAFLDYCATIYERMPTSAEEIRRRYETVQENRRLAAQAAVSAQPFPGWMPGDPDPLSGQHD